MQSVYIAGAGSGSGKSVVVLGFVEMLYAINRKVGFFRPIISKSIEQDNLTTLIRSRYDLPFSPEMLYGCTAETASHLVAAGQYDELLKMILNKFKVLEELCDLVVCAGTDFDGLVPSLEFDFNADLANNLGCSVVVVVKGFGRSPEEALEAFTWPTSRCAIAAATSSRASSTGSTRSMSRRSKPRPQAVAPARERLRPAEASGTRHADRRRDPQGTGLRMCLRRRRRDEPGRLQLQDRRHGGSGFPELHRGRLL
jgi:hypothetical protein